MNGRVWVHGVAWGAAVAALVAMSGISRASLGGPSYVEMLGWKPKEAKVFFVVHDQDETGDLSGVFYLDLAGRDRNRAQRVSWSLDTTVARGWRVKLEHYELKLKNLRSELARLRRRMAPTVPGWCEVLEVDTLRNATGPWPRYRIRVADASALGNDRLMVTSYKEPSVRFIDHYEIPGRRERIEIVSFIGKPYEMGYEVQVPIVLRPPRDSWEPRDTIEVRVPGSKP